MKKALTKQQKAALKAVSNAGDHGYRYGGHVHTRTLNSLKARGLIEIDGGCAVLTLAGRNRLR